MTEQDDSEWQIFNIQSMLIKDEMLTANSSLFGRRITCT